MYLHCLTAVLSCWPVHSFPHSHRIFFTSLSLRSNPRLLQHNRYHLTYVGRDIFLSFPLTLVPRLALSYKSSFSPLTPPNPLCCSMVWWQGASLLGRWDSNQSGLPRGVSDRRAQLPNCPQAGRQAGRLSRCNTCSQGDWCRRASWPPQRVDHFLGQMEAWMDLTTRAIWVGPWT